MVASHYYSKMPAPQGLLLETTRAEADHAEVQRKIDELARHYGAQEKQALADWEEKSKAIDAQFEKQRADMVAQVDSSLRESIGTILSEKRDLEIAALRRTHQEKAAERKKFYDQQKQQYDAELFRAMEALMTAGVSHLSRPIICRMITDCASLDGARTISRQFRRCRHASLKHRLQ
jgi:exonuclease VII large subunit